MFSTLDFDLWVSLMALSLLRMIATVAACLKILGLKGIKGWREGDPLRRQWLPPSLRGLDPV
jgi:hypothetical protein